MRGKARIAALLTLLVFLLGAVAPVVAADGTKTLKALFRNLQIVVDGKTLISDKEPFIVDGTTYVPIRLVSEATGATVDWDGTLGRVIITTKASVDPAELERIKQESYQAGYTAGELNGYVKGLQEGRSQVEDKAKKEKEYDEGYDDGYEAGEEDGYEAGEYDYEKGNRKDWKKAIASDSSISKTYKLSNKSDDYAEGFLDGYKDAFKKAYEDGYESYYDYDDGYDDGYDEGYIDGSRDKSSRLVLPRNSDIIDDFRLDKKSKGYRDGFIKGYKDGYKDGYDDNNK